MLTRDEILILPRIESEREVVELTFGDWLSVQDQAIAAIDLATENERLKAELDAVRKWASNPVRIDDFGYQMAQESVLAIIDKGDES